MSIGDTDFGVQVGIGFAGRVVTLLVAFLGAILLARVLGPNGYGAFYLLMAIVSFLDNPVTGWAIACRKRLTEKGFPAGEAIGSTLIGIGVSAVLTTASAFILAPQIAAFTGLEDGWLLLSVLFTGMALYLAILEVLKATAIFGSSDWMMATRDIVRVLAQAALVLGGLGVAGMVGGMVMANLLVAPIVLYLLGTRPNMPSTESVRQIWAFAKSSIPNGVVGTAQSKMDVLLLGALVGPGIVGNYEVAIRITLPAMFVAGVASNGLMGRISNRRSKDQNVDQDIENNLSFASLIAVPIFFGALTVGDAVVVTMFSNQYADAGAFVAGLALFHLFRSQKVILVSTLDGFGRPDFNLRVSTAVFMLNLMLGIGLFYVVGPIGIVLATIVSEVAGYGARAYIVHSFVPSVTLLPRPLFDQIMSGVVMAGVVFGIRSVVSLGWWGNVILIVGLGGLTYVTTLIIISESFRETTRAVARDAGIQ